MRFSLLNLITTLVSLACLFVSCPVCRTNELYFPLPWRRPRYAPQFSSVAAEDFGRGRRFMTRPSNECVSCEHFSRFSKPITSFFELERTVAVLPPSSTLFSSEEFWISFQYLLIIKIYIRGVARGERGTIRTSGIAMNINSRVRKKLWTWSLPSLGSRNRLQVKRFA